MRILVILKKAKNLSKAQINSSWFLVSDIAQILLLKFHTNFLLSKKDHACSRLDSISTQ